MTSLLKESINILIDGRNLSGEQAYAAMKEIMGGEGTPAQIAAFLTALRAKGETIEEIAAFVTVIKEHSEQIRPHVKTTLVDTCGTGGGNISTFNVSTIAAIVAAGAGVPVAKHGNRSVSSSCGSADLMEALGVNLNARPETVKESIEKVNIGFMFAPLFHPSFKYAAAPRKEIGIKTVFNILGPLTNPANATAQVLGVYDNSLVKKLAQAAARLQREEVMVVHGAGGIDEISTMGKTSVGWLKNGKVKLTQLSPKDFGVARVRPEQIVGCSPRDAARLTLRILRDGEDVKPQRDIVLANSAAGIVVGGKADGFLHAMEQARESLESGAAYRKLGELVTASGGDLVRIEELESSLG